MHEPGALIASGRDADIFEYGPGLVLRRSRRGRSMKTEARVMEHAHALGYPVPAVDQVSDDGTDLVMERLNGPSMLQLLSAQPWKVRRQGRLLAELHQRLHDIPAPEWLPAAPVGRGDALLHLDLHPLNVVITGRGPVVIDWTNACMGDPASDVALTWALMGGGEVPTGRVKGALLGWGRGLLINSFLAPFDRAAVGAHLPEVVEWKVTDPNMSPAEQKAMRMVARRG
jgi:aminoglycoside phosphotransferase (APT) family kinase protein